MVGWGLRPPPIKGGLLWQEHILNKEKDWKGKFIQIVPEIKIL